MKATPPHQTDAYSLLFYSIPFKGGVWPDEYNLVAVVDTFKPKEVFWLSQINDEHTQDELARITWLVDPPRSSMAGDIVLLAGGGVYCF